MDTVQQNPNMMNQQAPAKHKSRMGLLIILLVLAALLVVIMSVFSPRVSVAPGQNAPATSEAPVDESTAIQAELDSLEFEGLSEGI